MLKKLKVDRNLKDGGWLSEPIWQAACRHEASVDVVQAATKVGWDWSDVVHQWTSDPRSFLQTIWTSSDVHPVWAVTCSVSSRCLRCTSNWTVRGDEFLDLPRALCIRQSLSCLFRPRERRTGKLDSSGTRLLDLSALVHELERDVLCVDPLPPSPEWHDSHESQ